VAIYSKVLELISGVARTVDLSTNTLSVQGLQINAATGGGSITQAAHATTTTYSIVWPAAQAAGSNYVLANDGAGTLSWIASATGSVTAVTASGALSSSGGSTPNITLNSNGVTNAFLAQMGANVEPVQLQSARFGARFWWWYYKFLACGWDLDSCWYW
jgi:hypothetical protein